MPRCPTCGSTSITRQGIVGRAVTSTLIGAETVRWRITTIIAAFALVFSLFSLGWQIYTYRIEHNQVKNPPIQSETTDIPIDNSDNATNTIQP